MNDKELKRNGSGCLDLTAYEAMKNYENGGVAKMNIRKGEIWEVEHGKNNKYALVLTYKGGYCSVIMLNDIQREYSDIKLNARGMKYAESGMVTCKFVDTFVDYIRTVTDEEYEDVMKKVKESFGFGNDEMIESLKEEKAFLEEVLEKKILELEEMKISHAEEANSVSKDQAEEIIRLRVERDLYEREYRMLMEKQFGA